MNVGMLWLDTDRKRTLDEKVQRAAEYYQDKYGRLPDLCFVNNKSLCEAKNVGHVEVKTTRTVLPDHFWLGMAT